MSNMPAPTSGTYNGPPWTVTQVTQGTGQTDTGRYAPGWTVTYKLDSGPSGSVFLAGTTLDPDAVKTAIQAQATALHQTANLSSS